MAVVAVMARTTAEAATVLLCPWGELCGGWAERPGSTSFEAPLWAHCGLRGPGHAMNGLDM